MTAEEIKKRFNEHHKDKSVDGSTTEGKIYMAITSFKLQSEIQHGQIMGQIQALIGVQVLFIILVAVVSLAVSAC